MSTFRTPVGPQSSRVYWRRRLAVLLGVVVVIVIIILLVAKPGGSAKPASTKSPSPAQTSSSTTTAATCKPSILDVEAVTDALSYAPGVDPKISLTIENTSTKACSFKVGSDVQDYEITSGSEKIWSSKDCQTGAVALTETLKPGVPVSTTPFAWSRTRSDATTCDAKNPPQVTAKGASYHLGVAVNGVKSKKTRQFILK
jgi:hypothetical protein